MNVAGRKMVGSISTPRRPGRSVVERLLDAAGHLERVRPRLLLDDQQQARAVVDDRVADRRRVPPRHSADVAERERRAVGLAAVVHGHPGHVGRPHDRQHVVDGEPLVGRVDEAAHPVLGGVGVLQQAEVERVGRDRLGIVERHPVGAQPLGVDQHLQLLSRSPQIARWRRRAPPSAAAGSSSRRSSRGRSGSIVFDESPIFSTRLVDDSGGRITGEPRRGGQAGDRDRHALLHELAGHQASVPRLKISDDRREPERPTSTASSSRSGVPFSDFSIGIVISSRPPPSTAEALGLDLDERRRELGEHVHGHVLHPRRAERHHPHGERDHDEAEAQGRPDDEAHHGCGVTPLRSRTRCRAVPRRRRSRSACRRAGRP